MDGAPEFIALDRLLSSTYADDWPGVVRWLNEWRTK